MKLTFTNTTVLNKQPARCNIVSCAIIYYGRRQLALVFCVAKPIMITKFATIHKDQSTSNVMLTCAVRYAYPTAEITWNFITKSSRIYHVVEENSTGNYILHKNGSLEVYRHFIYEEDHVNVMCSASNKFGSAQTVFSIWDDEQFSPG